MKKVLIIGSGPAGISAALYLKRSGRIDVCVISGGSGSLARAERIENYYGLPEPVSGQALYEQGVSGAKRLGVPILEEEALSIGFDDSFRPFVTTNRSEHHADALLLATGAVRKSPGITGIRELEGRGVSYCAVCDAFFYRGKDVCVIGSGEYALHEASILANTSSSVTLLTNGETLSSKAPEGIILCEKHISSVEGEDTVERIVFDDGSSIETSGVFVALGTADSGDLARKAGAVISNGHIMVDQHMQTNIPGLFAAGDCTGGTLQIYKAVYEGATAAFSIINYLKK